MRRKKEIDEWALDYWLLQQYAKLCFRIYYRKIEFINRDRIPVNQPVIIAPNHQNALMDAMTFVTQTSFQNVFLARADIFKGKFMIRFLTYLNIMPVFRIRDGIENVKKNDEVFDKTTRVLHNSCNPLVIFPEGNHGDRRRLRQLVKGLFRIAFQAQEKFGTSPGVKILPVGIDYGHYEHFRTTLFINIGEPLEISDFFKNYTENPVLAINHLKDVYIERLGELMIDIQTEEFYQLYMDLREIYNDDMRALLSITGKSLYDKFRADKILIACLNRELELFPESIRTLNILVAEYQEDLRKAGIRDHVIKNRPYGMAGLIKYGIIKTAILPLFLAGFVTNVLPYWFTSSRVKNIKDRQFHSSFKYVVGMVVFPVWYLVIAGILAFLSLPIWLLILSVLLLPLTGLMAFEYYIRLRKVLGRLKYVLRKNSKEMVSLVQKRNQIVELVADLVRRHSNIYEIPR